MVTTAPEHLRSGVCFAQELARHGARTALREGARTLTYGELAARVAEEADALSGSERHLITLAPANTIDFVVLYLAALSAGHPVLLTDHDGLAAAYHVDVVRDGGRWRATGAAVPPLLFVENDFGRYSIGSTTDGLKKGADGSLTILIQNDKPADTSNWLPAPAGEFNLTMRFYGPQTSVLDGSYRLPAVKRVE